MTTTERTPAGADTSRVRRVRRRLMAFSTHSPLWRVASHPRVRRTSAMVVVGVIGAVIGVLLGSWVHHRVGPVDATFRLEPAWHGTTTVEVPPLGQLLVHSHTGPVRVDVSIDEVRLAAVQRLLHDSRAVDALQTTVATDVRNAMVTLALRTAASALAGALIAGILVFRRPRRMLASGAAGITFVLIIGTVGATTFRASSLEEPRFTGILASAPALIGNVRDIDERFAAYREELTKLVTNVSQLYGVASTLPTPGLADAETVRILWVSDIHDNVEAFGVMRSLVKQFTIDAIVDTGDLSDHGTAAEDSFYDAIRTLPVPYIYVRGNHDSATTQGYLERFRNVHVLDGQIASIAGIRWAGIGDPRFTPDQTRHQTTAEEQQTLFDAGSRLADLIDASSAAPDVALVHDPVAATPLFGHVPIVLTGHLHHRDQRYADGTLELIQGSSGGAGLRGLEGPDPLPLDFSVLYFSKQSSRLVAYDDVTVGGLGNQSVEIQRHTIARTIKTAGKPSPEPSVSESPPGSDSPTGSGSPASTPPSTP